MHVIEQNATKFRLLINGPEGMPMLVPVVRTALHDHPFGEVQIITDGEVVFTIDGSPHTVSRGGAIFIPAGIYHAVDPEPQSEASPMRIVFYLETNAKVLTVKQFPTELIADLCEKIARLENGSVHRHLFFLISELLEENEFKSTPFFDHEVLIREFFSLNYDKNIRLHELAQALCLSDMQAQRIVKKLTGKTFGENLLYQRMTVAENLMRKAEMPLSDIARYVGYNSYCGFWKAYKKYRHEQENEPADQMGES